MSARDHVRCNSESDVSKLNKSGLVGPNNENCASTMASHYLVKVSMTSNSILKLPGRV